tara:strand:+ start:163 stop:426 length:264 start_codon:yes stop_codon:yes gene_type:complete
MKLNEDQKKEVIKLYIDEKLSATQLIEEPDPWTDDELNELCYGNKCPCPIYSGLKEWTGAKQFPTQQNICDRGDQLIESIEIVKINQ